MSAPRSGGLPTRRQRVLHAAVLAAGWWLFAWSWWDVLGRQRNNPNLWVLLIAAGLLVSCLTGLWIWHNLSLHRRLGPRLAPMRLQPNHVVDFNGRRIDADWGALLAAREVTIEVLGRIKRYRVGLHEHKPPDR